MASTPLPENAVARTELGKNAAEIGKTPEMQAVPPLPPIATEISGNNYIFDENPLGWKSIGIIFPGGSQAILRMDIGFGPLDFPVGLDGLYRLREEEVEFPAVVYTGRWETGEETELVLDYDVIGLPDQGTFRLQFEGESLQFFIQTPEGWFLIPAQLEEGARE